MPSRIIFLGTAGNLNVVKTGSRSSGGFVIQAGDAQLHIDPGPGALTNSAMYGINVRAHTAILASHSHLNHCNDLNAIISAMTLNGLDNHGVLVAPETVIKSSILQENFARQLEKTIIAQPGKKTRIEDAEIQPLPAKHNDRKAAGYKIFTPEFVLAYTGDTSYDPEIAEEYKGADILVANCQYPGKSKEQGLCSSDIIRILNKAKPKLCILTHFSQKMLDAKPLYEVREIKKQTSTQVIAAEDGTTIDPASYSAGARQKTLNLFTKPSQKANQPDNQE